MKKKYLFIFVFLISFITIFLIFLLPKEYFFNFLVHNLALENKKEILKQQFFTAQKWQIIQFFIFFFCLFFTIITYFLKIKIDFIRIFIRNIIIFYHSKSKKEQYFFLFFVFISIFPAFIQLFIFPYLIDEVFAYTFLLNKGFLGIYPYYPGPNQHILFHLGSYFLSFTYIFHQNPILYLRFFAFLGFFLSVIGIGIWVWRQRNIDISVLSMLFFAYSPPILVYSFLGRGYSWQVFLTLLNFYFLLKITNNIHQNTIHLFIFVNIIGLLIIPTHLFVVGSGMLYILFSFQYKIFFFISFRIFVIVFVFYLPIILFNGFAALLQNDWIKSIELNSFFSLFLFHFLSIFNYLLADFFIFFLFIFLFFGVYSYKKIVLSHQKIIFFYILFPLLFCLIRVILPPERVFTYFMIGFLYIFIQFLSVFSRKYIYLFLIIPLFFLTNHFYLFPKNSEAFIFTQKIINQYNPKNIKIFANQDEYQVFFRYFCIQKKIKIDIEVNNFDEKKLYHYIVFDKKRYEKKDFPIKNYEKIFENKEIIAFVLIN